MKSANKISGYLLLVLGLGTIIYCAFNVYQIFKGQVLPYNLFSFKPIAMDLSQLVAGAPKNSLTQELISSDLLNKPMNLIFHILLMGFITTAGFKIASLGVMLVRPIKVHLKEGRPTTTSSGPIKPTWK